MITGTSTTLSMFTPADWRTTLSKNCTRGISGSTHGALTVNELDLRHLHLGLDPCEWLVAARPAPLKSSAATTVAQTLLNTETEGKSRSARHRRLTCGPLSNSVGSKTAGPKTRPCTRWCGNRDSTPRRTHTHTPPGHHATHKHGPRPENNVRRIALHRALADS